MSDAVRIGLLISSDLFFTSKITGTAQALGLRVDSVDNLEQLSTATQSGNIGCVLLDLASGGPSVADVVAALPTAASIPIVAFGSHVNVEQLAAAEAAGATVLPRSRFSVELPTLLSTLLRAD